jgi:SAM-dependent methyltransferase
MSENKEKTILVEGQKKNLIKLNLGSGNHKPIGYINLDISSEFRPDIVCNFELGLPLKDNSIDEIIAYNIIEHLPNIIFIMNELWRVLKQGGLLEICVPHEFSVFAHADPTHKKIFNEESFKYFCSNAKHYWIHQSYGIKCNFYLISQKVKINRYDGYILVKMCAIKNESEKNMDLPLFKNPTIIEGIKLFLSTRYNQGKTNILLRKK